MGDIFDAAGKVIDINNFQTDILADVSEESRIVFYYTIYVKGVLSKPNEFSHEKWT